MQKQKGFTLIELIIVIVVLGILAVTAAPQFINFSSDARESTLNGLRGSMNGAADLIYGKSALEGIEGDGFDTDYTANEVEGVEVIFGYPVASTTGIIAALNIDTADWDIVEEAAAADASLIISPVGLNGENPEFTDFDPDGECFIQYTNATATARPAITVDETGC